MSIKSLFSHLFRRKPVKPEPTIEFMTPDGDGFSQVTRDGEPVAKFCIWDRETTKVLRAIVADIALKPPEPPER